MAEKLSSGNYRARVTWTDSNKQRHSKSFTGKTAAEADFLAAEYKHNMMSSQLPDNVTVGDAIDRKIEAQRGAVSPTTTSGDLRYRKLYYSQIENMKISKLTDIIAQEWVKGLLTRGLSRKTIENAFGLLTKSLHYASFKKELNITLPTKEKRDIIIPEKADIDNLLDMFRGTVLYIPTLLAAHCGLRRSEIAGLEWKDIDYKKKLLHVRRAVVLDEIGARVVKGTKSYEGARSLNMSNQLIDALKETQDNPKPCIASINYMSNGFKRKCKKRGYDDYHIHLLRHYYASVLISLNVPIKYVIEMMGHGSEKMVMKVYAHMMKEKEQEISKTVLDYFNADCG